MGTVELTPKGSIKKTLLAGDKDFKTRALLPAVTEINEKTDIAVSLGKLKRFRDKFLNTKTVQQYITHGKKEFAMMSEERRAMLDQFRKSLRGETNP